MIGDIAWCSNHIIKKLNGFDTDMVKKEELKTFKHLREELNGNS
jgi:hypothetical protein